LRTAHRTTLKSASAGSPGGSKAPARWDGVYGAGYFTAHVLGSKDYARATLTGSKGTVLNVELSNENDTRGNTKGVAADNNGNVFKVSVYN
jgi:hypothetical protein